MLLISKNHKIFSTKNLCDELKELKEWVFFFNDLYKLDPIQELLKKVIHIGQHIKNPQKLLNEIILTQVSKTNHLSSFMFNIIKEASTKCTTTTFCDLCKIFDCVTHDHLINNLFKLNLIRTALIL